MNPRRIIAGLLTLFASTIVLAGGSNLVEVFVFVNDDGSATASGSMSGARAANNDIEIIGCGVKAFKSGGPDFGFCQAADANDTYVVCFTTKSNLLRIIDSIADYSYIRFDVDPDGECTRIDLSTQSFYLPGS